MARILRLEIPTGYAVCQQTDCPLASTCLHQIAYQQLSETDEYLHLINPQRCTKDDSCKYFRDSSPIVYARGFTNFQKKMFPQQYDTFKSLCIARFGRNPYFERRRGATALPPAEQEFILKALSTAGVESQFAFDSYEEHINLFD